MPREALAGKEVTLSGANPQTLIITNLSDKLARADFIRAYYPEPDNLRVVPLFAKGQWRGYNLSRVPQRVVVHFDKFTTEVKR